MTGLSPDPAPRDPAPTHSTGAPVLVADIGGTNARFALAHADRPAPEPLPSVPTGAHADFQSAARAALSTTHPAARAPDRPRHAIIAVAGPVTGAAIPLTNADWVIDPRAVLSDLDLETLIVLNDFEAQALALPVLGADDLLQIGSGQVLAHAPKVVLGPGTGLGVAAMVRANGRWLPIPGEGGHVEIGPVTAEEYRVWPHLDRLGGRIGAEQILSGAGLVRLSQAIARAQGAAPRFEAPQEIPEAAARGEPVAAATLETFARVLGRVAGDHALTFLARGGVYLAGGIPPRIEAHLTRSGFRDAFEAKAPHEALMTGIPTFLVRHPAPALAGLAAYARDPQAFTLDLTGRLWTRTA